MNRIFLVLLTRPTLLGSILSLLVTINPAQASEIISQTSQTSNQKDLVCVPSVHTGKLVCVKKVPPVATTAQANTNPGQDNTPMLDFTEEESDAAVALFGCDCPACIRSLRQLRGQTT